MDTTTLNSRTVQALAVFVFGVVASANVQAQSSYPTAVDTYCTSVNNTTPVTKFSSYGGSRCNICHNANNRSISRLPEWDWTAAGNTVAGRQHFCFVQGIIELPAANMTISQGGTIALKARGFSPRGATSPLTYLWTFSDGRTFTGPAQTVPMPTTGQVTVTLTASDLTGAVVEADQTPETRVITVSNTPTAASPDSYTIPSGSTLAVPSSIGVLANDTGIGALTAALGTNVVHGALNFRPNGSFDYTSNAGYVGPDTYTYTASNGVVASSPATVTINVTAAPPVANADSYSVLPGASLSVAAPGVLANDSGSGSLTAVLGTTATKGTLALNANGGFSYTPTAGFAGIDSFTYKAKIGVTESAPAAVKLEVGTCTDKDKDGYSPEGGSCGPLDCNDKHPAINPGVKEICGNLLDDDCNGKTDQADPGCSGADCVGTKLANQVKIDSAAWALGKLTVTGSKAAVGATVNIADAVTGAALGAASVAYNGTWKFEKAVPSSANAACRVQAAINGATSSRVVSGTTANCASNNGAPPSCGP